MGRGASERNLLFDPRNSSMDLYRIDRGGEVTHHLPGQLVVYPVLDLHRHKQDLHWYLRKLEAVLIDVLDHLDLEGETIPGMTGVWIKGRKVASIGVGCRRWVTQHGLALNIDCEMDGFQNVIPCGLHECPMGRLKDWIPGISVPEVQPLMKKAISKAFNITWKKQPLPESRPGQIKKKS